MNKRKYVRFAALPCLLVVLAAGLQAQFIRTYGGPYDDVPGMILATPDGGFVVFGNTDYNSTTPWLIKLAADGTVEWEKAYGVSGNGARHTLCATPDGGYLLVGGGAAGVWLIKTDGLGVVEWSNSVANSGSYYDWPPYSVCPAGDTGYFVAGTTMAGPNYSDTTDVWVIKIGFDGSLLWQKMYGLGGWELGLGVEPAADGGCVVLGKAGQTEFAMYDGRLIAFEIDAFGAVSWQRKYNIPLGQLSDVLPQSIRRTDDGGYLLTAMRSDGGELPYEMAGTVLKIGADGSIAWSRNGARNLYDAVPVEGGGAIVVGTAGTYDETDILVIKLQPSGSVEWAKVFGGSLKDEGRAAVMTAAGDYAVAGTTVSFGAGAKDICVLRISSAGELASGCRFAKGTGGAGEFSGATQEDIGLTLQDTTAAIEGINVPVTDTSGSSRNYQLCTEKKLLTINSNIGASTTDPAAGSYPHDAGDTVSITAAPTASDYSYTYNFENWGGDVTGTANPITVTVNDDMTVQAQYVIDWGDDGGGGGDGDGGGGGCFIATAAYRSPFHPAVRIFREFRDRRLATNGLGRIFIAAYYRWSPPFARAIGRSGVLRFLARILLIPMIPFALIVLKLGWLLTFLLMAAATVLAFRHIRARLRLPNRGT